MTTHTGGTVPRLWLLLSTQLAFGALSFPSPLGSSEAIDQRWQREWTCDPGLVLPSSPCDMDRHPASAGADLCANRFENRLLAGIEELRAYAMLIKK